MSLANLKATTGYQEAIQATEDIEPPAVGFAKTTAYKGGLTNQINDVIKQNNTLLYLASKQSQKLIELEEKFDRLKQKVHTIIEKEIQPADLEDSLSSLAKRLDNFSISGKLPVKRTDGKIYKLYANTNSASTQEDQIRGYRQMARNRHQVVRTTRRVFRRNNYNRTLETAVDPERQLEISRKRRANLVPAVVLYSNNICTARHGVYEHYSEQRILCVGENQINLRLCNEESYESLRNSGLHHIHLRIFMIRLHALHRRSTETNALVVLRDTRWEDSRQIIATMKVDLSAGTQLVYTFLDMILSVNDFHNHVEVAIQTHGYDTWQGGESNLLITMALTGRLSNTSYMGFQYSVENVVDHLTTNSITSIPGERMSIDELEGMSWNLKPPEQISVRVPSRVAANERLNRLVSLRFERYRQAPQPPRYSVDQHDREVIGNDNLDEDEEHFVGICLQIEHTPYDLEDPTNQDDQNEGQKKNGQYLENHLENGIIMNTTPIEEIAATGWGEEFSDDEVTLGKVTILNGSEEGSDWDNDERTQIIKQHEEHVFPSASQEESTQSYQPPHNSIMRSSVYPPAQQNPQPFCRPDYQFGYPQGKDKSFSGGYGEYYNSQWTLPSAWTELGVMLVLPTDPSLWSKRTVYPEAYSALEAIPDEPQNITSQVRQLNLLEDPYRGSTDEQDRAYMDLDRITCEETKNLWSFLEDFKQLATKSGRLYFPSTTEKLFAKLPPSLSKKIEESFRAKYHGLNSGVLPAIKFTHTFVSEMCKDTALAKELRDLSLFSVIPIPGYNKNNRKKYGMRKSRTYKLKPHNYHVKPFKRKYKDDRGRVKKCKCFICGKKGILQKIAGDIVSADFDDSNVYSILEGEGDTHQNISIMVQDTPVEEITFMAIEEDDERSWKPNKELPVKSKKCKHDWKENTVTNYTICYYCGILTTDMSRLNCKKGQLTTCALCARNYLGITVNVKGKQLQKLEEEKNFNNGEVKLLKELLKEKTEQVQQMIRDQAKEYYEKKDVMQKQEELWQSKESLNGIEMLIGSNFLRSMKGGIRIEGDEITIYKKVTKIKTKNQTEITEIAELEVNEEEFLEINESIYFNQKGSKAFLEQFKPVIERLKHQGLLKIGAIRPSKSRHRTMAMIVNSGTIIDPVTGKQVKGKQRMVFNYKSLNDNTYKDQYSLPGFHQVAMDEESIPWTAFLVPGGLYEWLVLPFGLKNAPVVFQRKMDKCFKGTESFIAVYIDDILVFLKNEKEHSKHLERMLKICEDNGLVLSPTKMKIAVSTVDLGAVIGEGTIKLQPHIIKKIVNFNEEELKTKKGLSGKFSTTQSTIDAEINACINTLEKQKIYYLDKQEVTLRTNCQAIISFYNKTNSNKSLRVKWIKFADAITGTGVKINIEHIEGKHNTLVDSLSRLVNLCFAECTREMKELAAAALYSVEEVLQSPNAFQKNMKITCEEVMKISNYIQESSQKLYSHMKNQEHYTDATSLKPTKPQLEWINLMHGDQLLKTLNCQQQKKQLKQCITYKQSYNAKPKYALDNQPKTTTGQIKEKMFEFKTRKPEESSSNWKPWHRDWDATTSNFLEDDTSNDDNKYRYNRKEFLEDDDACRDDLIFIVDPGWDDYYLQELKFNRPIPFFPEARTLVHLHEPENITSHVRQLILLEDPYRGSTDEQDRAYRDLDRITCEETKNLWSFLEDFR
nr:retrotransposon protein, putative, Ty3-gypsy subclass [Tanacetum cinerariifolium]